MPAAPAAPTAVPAAGTYLGEVAGDAEILAGWPIIADGQGGTVTVSPTTSCWGRGDGTPTSTLSTTELWDAVNAWCASDLYRVYRAGYDAQRAAARERQLAEIRAQQPRRLQPPTGYQH